MEIKLKTSFETKTGNHVSETVNRITNPPLLGKFSHKFSQQSHNKRDPTLKEAAKGSLVVVSVTMDGSITSTSLREVLDNINGPLI